MLISCLVATFIYISSFSVGGRQDAHHSPFSGYFSVAIVKPKDLKRRHNEGLQILCSRYRRSTIRQRIRARMNRRNHITN
ncbi:hypothetical protein EDD15DRAFT_2308031 [Pisolithus albus]|nr:hypothetical protein EDD15DRAFT_2308031 [Pisolithus albus]